MTPVSIQRTSINRANAQHSTGPRSEAGKQRSALNALTHGLTARTAVLPSEDPAAFEQHCRQFLEEYRPATPTETQLVHELADTSWRMNRIPLLEADVLSRGQSPAPSPEPPAFDIVDAHRLLPRSDSTASASPASSKKPLTNSRPSASSVSDATLATLPPWTKTRDAPLAGPNDG